MNKNNKNNIINNSNLEFKKIKSLKFLYEINSNGTIIRNIKSKKQLKIKLDNDYYVTFIPIKSKKLIYKQVMIDTLVAECWLGDKSEDMEIIHIDHNLKNNDYRNLRYIIKNEQIKKSVRIYNKEEEICFESYSSCSKYIAEKGNCNIKHIQNRLRQQRKFIFGYNVEYIKN